MPDTYPLTLNALAAGCNQKSSRNPLFNATESEVQAAVDNLKRHSLVIESSGGRVMRYAQNVKRVLEIPSQSVALLATLVLRGPQTAGELRINSDRLNRFSDISAVEGFLNEIADRPAGALVVELPRQAGSRETRWAHLLGGPPPAQAAEAAGTGSAASGETSRSAARAATDLSLSDTATLNARLARLEDQVALLEATVAQLCDELGVASPITAATPPTLAQRRQEEDREGG